jgi:hypothetical protein
MPTWNSSTKQAHFDNIHQDYYPLNKEGIASKWNLQNKSTLSLGKAKVITLIFILSILNTPNL